MPSLNLSDKKLRYTHGDERLLVKAHDLLFSIQEYETNNQAKIDAASGLTALKHLIEHIKGQRNGRADKPK